MKHFFYSVMRMFLLFFCLKENNCVAQTDSTSGKDNIPLLGINRVRIYGGYFEIRAFGNSNSNVQSFPLFNVNYRFGMEEQMKENKLKPVSIVGEIGTNLILIPYFKIGPDFHFSNNLYADIHGGISVFFLQGIIPAPFAGAEVGFTTKISNKTSIEIEAGVNGLQVYIPYIAIGFGFY